MLCAAACRWAECLQLGGRLHFVMANGTISMRSMLASYPGQVQMVCVQFPDPHFKKRHHKRRIVQPSFCSDVAAILPSGGMLCDLRHIHQLCTVLFL